jgi:GxxExxY protein
MKHKDTKDTKEKANDLSLQIIAAGIEVHRRVGPGLLESVYEECMCTELNFRRIAFQRQVSLPIQYRNRLLECSYRLDLLVENLVVVELKAVEQVLPVHKAQVLSYLRLKKLWLGLLINFNVPALKFGIERL